MQCYILFWLLNLKVVKVTKPRINIPVRNLIVVHFRTILKTISTLGTL